MCYSPLEGSLCGNIRNRSPTRWALPTGGAGARGVLPAISCCQACAVGAQRVSECHRSPLTRAPRAPSSATGRTGRPRGFPIPRLLASPDSTGPPGPLWAEPAHSRLQASPDALRHHFSLRGVSVYTLPMDRKLYDHIRYHLLKAAGLCTKCHIIPTQGVRCPTCRGRNNSRNTTRRRQRKVDGLCRYCTRLAVSGTLCSRHYDYETLLRRDRRSWKCQIGFCTECREPVLSGHSLCESHYARRRCSDQAARERLTTARGWYWGRVPI